MQLRLQPSIGSDPFWRQFNEVGLRCPAGSRDRVDPARVLSPREAEGGVEPARTAPPAPPATPLRPGPLVAGRRRRGPRSGSAIRIPTGATCRRSDGWRLPHLAAPVGDRRPHGPEHAVSALAVGETTARDGHWWTAAVPLAAAAPVPAKLPQVVDTDPRVVLALTLVIAATNPAASRKTVLQGGLHLGIFGACLTIAANMLRLAGERGQSISPSCLSEARSPRPTTT